MPIQLKRTGRLLKQVGGHPHASREDHDDVVDTQTVTKEEEDALINADPVSSDEDTIEASPQITASKPAAPSTSSTSSKPSRQFNGVQTYDQKRGNQTGIRAPKAGTYGRGKAAKEGKENSRPSPRSSRGKRAVEEEEDKEIFFDFSQSPPKRQRVSQATSNIHSRADKAQGMKNKTTYQSKTSKGMRSFLLGAGLSIGLLTFVAKPISCDPDPFRSLRQYADNYSQANETIDDDLSDFSDVSLKSLPEEVKTLQRRAKNGKKKSALPVPQAPSVERTSMLDTLAQYRHDAAPTSSQILASQGNDHVNPGSKDSAASTPLSSLDSPEFALDGSTPFGDGLSSSEDKCPLCGEPVQPEHYREFWQSRKMTVRHQSTFCHDHHKIEAQGEYKKLGYPEIDWDALPTKIEKHYPRLTAIVRNEPSVPSAYRDLYAERAEAGERQHVSKMIEENTTAMTKTGYYGARGHRMFMESITNQLSDVIRQCAIEDSTVTHGGMANFVLHVLVPELTIRLVMDESSVSENMAKQIIEESGEIGAKVHEEEGDTIERADSEDENET
jgi:hypothetical protein